MKKTDLKMTGVITDLDRKTPSGKIIYACCVLALVLITLICVVPLAWAVLSGFKSVNEFYSSTSPSFIPRKFVTANIMELFTKFKIQKYALNSLWLVLGTIFVEITFTATGGYVLSKIKPIGGKMLLMLILWTIMMPQTLSMVPLFMTFIDFPLIHVNFMNTYFPMWLMAGANCFNIMLFKNFFDEIPQSYFEAAMLDGAGKLQIFYTIILPLSKPILATVLVFAIQGAWNNFMWPLLLIKKETLKPLALALYNSSEGMQAPQQLMFAVLVSVPMIIVYFIAQRFIVSNSVGEGEKG